VVKDSIEQYSAADDGEQVVAMTMVMSMTMVVTVITAVVSWCRMVPIHRPGIVAFVAIPMVDGPMVDGPVVDGSAVNGSVAGLVMNWIAVTTVIMASGEMAPIAVIDVAMLVPPGAAVVVPRMGGQGRQGEESAGQGNQQQVTGFSGG